MYKVNFGSNVLERYVLFKQKIRKNCNSCCNYDDMVTMMTWRP